MDSIRYVTRQCRVPKKAVDPYAFARPAIAFPNARTAFRAFMEALGLTPKDVVLLPAYVGWSKREGSGVYDPVREIGVSAEFYRVTRELAIDLDDLQYKLSADRVKLLVLIHYFGYPERCLPEIIALARDRDVLILEDEAHALCSDLVGGICGRFGDAAILSLHKILPFESGGLLLLNNPMSSSMGPQLERSPLRSSLVQSPLDYDLVGISARRRHNAELLSELLQPLAGALHPLRPRLPEGVVPQSYPVIISNACRDDLYFRLNGRGYGVVSLYHTLIDQIQESEFPDAHWVSRRILNLPVHQDVCSQDLEALVEELSRLLV